LINRKVVLTDVIKSKSIQIFIYSLNILSGVTSERCPSPRLCASAHTSSLQRWQLKSLQSVFQFTWNVCTNLTFLHWNWKSKNYAIRDSSLYNFYCSKAFPNIWKPKALSNNLQVFEIWKIISQVRGTNQNSK